MKIEVGKLYKTSSDLKARIYATDCGDVDSWAHGAVYDGDHWEPASWGEDGRVWSDGFEHIYDLVDYWPEPVKEEFEIVVHGPPSSTETRMQTLVDLSQSLGLYDINDVLIDDKGNRYIYTGQSPTSIERPHPLYIDKPQRPED